MRCLPTPRAVEMLGRSKLTLLRYAERGHLTAGVHFFRGPYANSPITWDVERCQQRFAELARMPALKPRPREVALPRLCGEVDSSHPTPQGRLMPMYKQDAVAIFRREAFCCLPPSKNDTQARLCDI